MKRLKTLLLSAFLGLSLLVCPNAAKGQGGQTSQIRYGTVLPIACKGADVFVANGVFYWNNTVGPGACSWTSNAPTATALANTPSQCSGQFATGIAANGNTNCGSSFSQFAGVGTPASVSLTDISGSGTLVANTQYAYSCDAYNSVGMSSFAVYATITTANDGFAHKVRVTCATVTGSSLVGYGFFGRTLAGGISYMQSCTAAATPVSQCTAANVFVDDGTIANGGAIYASTAINNSTGVGFGPPSGSPTAGYKNPTPNNDTWLSWIFPGVLALTDATNYVSLCFDVRSGTITSSNAASCVGTNASVDATGNYPGIFLISGSKPYFSYGFYTGTDSYVTGVFHATKSSYSGVRTAVLSAVNTVATCDLSLGDTCLIVPVTSVNITTVTVSNMVASGHGYDFVVVQPVVPVTVNFSSAPFHGAWVIGATSLLYNSAHYASPDGTNLLLVGYTNNQ